MKYILSIYFIITNILFADMIDESKTDIYFGNGVFNSKEAADISRNYLEKFIIQREIIKQNPKLAKRYGSVKLAYNWGQGMMTDVLETFYQLKQAGQVTDLDFYTVVFALTGENIPVTISAGVAKKLYEPLNRDWEQGNVEEMWRKYYNESFKLSHRVLLVSHSQGNLFANRIYNRINPTEYRDYFTNLQIASPASEVKAPKGDHVTLVGDPIINPIPKSMSGNAHGKPGHAFIGAYLAQSDPLQKIIKNIKLLLPTVESEISQWQTDSIHNEGTKQYRVKVKHRFDSKVQLYDDVFPFNLAKYLYPVPDENNKTHYVKASFDGEKIKDLQADWLNGCNNDLDFYLLEGTGEKITGLPVKWEKISEKNRGTCDWRLTVENNLTKEVLTDVYPFDPDNGHVYKLDTGEVVMAKCGGETLLDNWEGKRIYNCYLLKETNEKINIDMNITVTGKITTAECKMTQKGKNESFGFWAEGCKYTNVCWLSLV